MTEQYDDTRLKDKIIADSGDEFDEVALPPLPQPDSLFKRIFSTNKPLSPADEILDRLDQPLESKEKAFRKHHRNKELNLVCSGVLAERFKKIMKKRNVYPTIEFAKRLHSNWVKPTAERIVDDEGFSVWLEENRLEKWLKDELFLLPTQAMLNSLESELGFAPNSIATLWAKEFQGNKHLFLLCAGMMDENQLWKQSSKKLKIVKHANKCISEIRKQRIQDRKSAAAAKQQREKDAIRAKEKQVKSFKQRLMAAFNGACEEEKK